MASTWCCPRRAARGKRGWWASSWPSCARPLRAARPWPTAAASGGWSPSSRCGSRRAESVRRSCASGASTSSRADWAGWAWRWRRSCRGGWGRGEWRGGRGRGEGGSRTLRRLLALEERGSEVLVVGADVSRPEQMEAAVARTLERFGELHGVVHSAGSVNEDTFFLAREATPARCASQVQAKVHGLLSLHQALRGRTLDFVVLQSSLSSVLGGLGFSAYAAANSFMDVFAAERSREQGTPWVSVNWDGWHTGEGAPAELTMALADGLEAFHRLLSAPPLARWAVSTADLPARIALWLEPKAPPPPTAAPAPPPPPPPPATSHRETPSRRASSPAGRSCSASMALAWRTTSSNWEATRCWARRCSRGCAMSSRWSCPCAASSTPPPSARWRCSSSRTRRGPWIRTRWKPCWPSWSKPSERPREADRQPSPREARAVAAPAGGAEGQAAGGQAPRSGAPRPPPLGTRAPVLRPAAAVVPRAAATRHGAVQQPHGLPRARAPGRGGARVQPGAADSAPRVAAHRLPRAGGRGLPGHPAHGGGRAEAGGLARPARGRERGGGPAAHRGGGPASLRAGARPAAARGPAAAG